MAPSSIAIKIDFGAEGGGTNVLLGGGVPAPTASGGSAASAMDQSAAAMPTPFDNSEHMMGQAGATATAPEPGIVPGENAGSTSSGGASGEVPTPLSADAYAPALSGSSEHAIPTPFDSATGYDAAHAQGPVPEPGDGPPTDSTAPSSPEPHEGAARKVRK